MSKIFSLSNFRFTTILKAFILNSIIAGIYFGINIHIRNKIDIFIYTKDFSETEKL